MRLLGISGSLRRDSHNTKLLREAQSLLPPGVELEIYDGLGEIPPYNEDDEKKGLPSEVVYLKELIAGSDGLIFATPEYNSSIPGQLKNAIDWASRPSGSGLFRGKPAVVIGASSGLFGAVWAQAELRKVLSTLGADVLDQELPISLADEAFTDEGQLVDEEMRDALEGMLYHLASAQAEPGSIKGFSQGPAPAEVPV